MFRLNKKTYQKLLFRFVLYAAFIILFAYLHLLAWKYIIILMVLLALIIPIDLYAESKRNYEKQRFDELCLYVKYMLINYKISNKILQALKDTLEIFETPSTMRQCVIAAIRCIEHGQPYDIALQEIEKKYCNSYIKQMHQFMILGEIETGMTVYTSLSQINIKQWQQDVEVFEMNKAKIKHRNLYFAILSFSLSFFTVLVLQDYKTSLQTDPYYQKVTFVYFALFFVAYIVSTLMLTGKWIKENE